MKGNYVTFKLIVFIDIYGNNPVAWIQAWVPFMELSGTGDTGVITTHYKEENVSCAKKSETLLWRCLGSG